jgi:ComF family protein
MCVIHKVLGFLSDLIAPTRTEVRIVRALDAETVQTLFQPHHIGATTALTHYRDPRVRSLIHAHKFYREPLAQRWLATLCARWLTTQPVGAILVPIPLSRSRERTRGFNQVSSVLEEAATQLDQTITITPLLVRTIDTRPQSHLARTDRHDNIRGAFAWNTAYDPKILPLHHIIVVDDVMTTGATLTEADRVLRQHIPKHCTITHLTFAH